MLFLVFSLFGCSSQEKTDYESIDKTENILDVEKNYPDLFDDSKAEISFSDNEISVKKNEYEEFMKILLGDEEAVVQIALEENDKTNYFKYGEENEARLETVYYVNWNNCYNQTLYCTLQADDYYKFFYESGYFYSYNEPHEEIHFDPSLHFELKELCEEMLEKSKEKENSCYLLAHEILQSKGMDHLKWKENEKALKKENLNLIQKQDVELETAYPDLFENSKAEVEVLDDQICVKKNNKEFMNIQLNQKKAVIQIEFEDQQNLSYLKKGIEKEAILKTAFHVNQDGYDNRLIYCDLSVKDQKDHYSFFYDQDKDTIYLYDEDQQEEILFTPSLHVEIRKKCRKLIKKYRADEKACYLLATDLLISQGIDEIELKEKENPSHTFKFINYLNPMFLFEDFTIDSIVPIYEDHDLIYGLYAVEKDGYWGIMNDDGELLLPIESEEFPQGSFDEIHYSISSSRLFPHVFDRNHKEYRLCSGGHGLSVHIYYLIKDQGVNRIDYGHDGLGSLTAIKENELNGKLSTCQLLIETDSEEGSDISFSDEDFRYFSSTGKYAVFSDKGQITDAVYDGGLPTNGDLAAVCKDGLWGYVNAEGKEIIPCQYLPVYIYQDWNEERDAAFPPYDGYIAVKNQNKKFGILDYDGNEIVPFEYDYAFIYNKNALVRKGKEWMQIELSSR